MRDGCIAALGDLAGHTADRVLDATGLIVAPGFIDAHTHDDQAVLSQPTMPFKVSQGVTTVIAGNCGISAAPLRAGMDLPMPLSLIGTPAEGRFTTFAAYLDALRATPSSVNVAAMVGHSTLRAVTMAALDRPADAAEIAAMQALVEEAMQAGAIGLSTGTFYPPAAMATTEEIIEVCRPLSVRKALYVTHMRDESDQVMASLDETFRIGRELDVPVVVSHHKVQRQANFGKSQVTLPYIREAMKHQCVSLDCYPYTAGSTMIRTDRGMLDGRVLIAASEPHPECAGRDLDDIAREWGVPKDEAARRLQPGTAIYFQMDEDDVQRILAFDETMIGSDGIPVAQPASAPVGHLPTHTGALLPRGRPVPAGDGGLENDRADGAQFRPAPARHARRGQPCRSRRLRCGERARCRQLRDPHPASRRHRHRDRQRRHYLAARRAQRGAQRAGHHAASRT